MRVSEMISMLLIVGIFMIGGSLFLADMGSSWGVPNVPNLAILNRTSEIASKMNETQVTMKETSTGNIITDTANSAWNYIGFMSSAFIQTGLLLLNAPGMFTNMFANEAGTGLLQIIPVPGWFTAIITVIITTMIIFAIYRTVAKSDI